MPAYPASASPGCIRHAAEKRNPRKPLYCISLKRKFGEVMEIKKFEQMPLIEKFRLLKEKEARLQELLKEVGLDN